MSSNADLGFIRNRTDLRAPNRSLVGAPSFTSKKGVMNPSQVFKGTNLHDNQEKNDSSPPPPRHVATTMSHTGPLLEKRCDFLETQEKHQREILVNTNDKLQKLQGKIEDTTLHKTMYNEMQWAFGTVNGQLMGVSSNEEDSMKVMDNFDSKNLVPVEHKNRIMLVYPMIMKETETNEQCFMRMKSINHSTGQLNYTWVMIYELVKGADDGVIRYVSEFSLTS